jgi:hypothetical protein
MHIDQTTYRTAFLAYLRKGTPIKLEMKADRTSNITFGARETMAKCVPATLLTMAKSSHGKMARRPATPEKIIIADVGQRRR